MAGFLCASATNFLTTLSNACISSLVFPCWICMLKPAACPMPGMGAGGITTTLAFLIPAAITLCLMTFRIPGIFSLGSFLSSHGFNVQNMVPLLELAPPFNILNPEKAAKCVTPGVVPTTFVSLVINSTDCVVDDASGNWYVTNKRPPSSGGINPEGFVLNKNHVPAQIQINNMTIYLDPLILFRTPFEYLSVTRSNQTLYRKNNLFMPFASFVIRVGLNNNVQSAGVSDKATNAESITEIAIVMANC